MLAGWQPCWDRDYLEKNKEHLDPDYYYTYTPPKQYSLSLRARF